MKKIYLLLVAFSSTISLGAETRIFLEGMTCPSCARAVERALSEIDGYLVKTVAIKSISTGEVIVKTEGNKPLTNDVINKDLKETRFKIKSVGK